MPAPLIQPSFAAGELSEQLLARVDLDKFFIGLARARNVFVDYRGGITSRPGTRLITKARSQDSTKPVRLIRFQFSVLQTYVLEFGDFYMRVYRGGGLVAPGGVPYVLETPWAAQHVSLLKFAQSNDVMTITHPEYPPYDLLRLADDNWQVRQILFRTNLAPPQIATFNVQVGDVGDSQDNQYFDYIVTSVGFDGAESAQSLHGFVKAYSFDEVKQSITISITAVANASYYKFYKARPSLATPQQDRPTSAPVYGFIGSSEGLQFQDNNIQPDFLQTPPKHRDPFRSKGIIKVTPTNPGTNYSPQTYLTVTDSTGVNASLVPIFNASSIVGAQILDSGQDYTNPTITAVDPVGVGNGATFSARIGEDGGNNPGVVTYYQQRKVFAATLRQPATYWTTRPGQFNNMDVSSPVQDDDATTFTLAALEQNPIKYMIPMQNGLVMLTGGAAWLVSGGGESAAFGPTSVRQTPQAYDGAADVQPLVIGFNILYVQEKGFVVKDLKYDFISSTYIGEDRTYLSSHLFNTPIKEWCFADQPYRLVWAVLADGGLLSMTYLPDQKVYGWTRHETQGFIESIVSCPEGDEDYVYMVVSRASGRYVERMESRKNWNITSDVWALDGALKYSGPPVTTVSGLDDNIGQALSVVADGKYVGNKVVGPSGSLILDNPASHILVGWSYNVQAQTMYLDTKSSPTIQSKRKFLPRVTFRVVDTSGMFVGRDFANLDPVKMEVDSGQLATKDVSINLNGGWDDYGQVCVLGDVGAAISITAIIPELQLGDNRG